MNWIVARIKGIMLVSGVLTCTMVQAAIAVDSVWVLVFAGYLVSTRRG